MARKSKKASPVAMDMDKYEIEDAARILKRSQEIRTDKLLFGKAKRKLRDEQIDIAKILKGAR